MHYSEPSNKLHTNEIWIIQLKLRIKHSIILLLIYFHELLLPEVPRLGLWRGNHGSTSLTAGTKERGTDVMAWITRIPLHTTHSADRIVYTRACMRCSHYPRCVHKGEECSHPLRCVHTGVGCSHYLRCVQKGWECLHPFRCTHTGVGGSHYLICVQKGMSVHTPSDVCVRGHAVLTPLQVCVHGHGVLTPPQVCVHGQGVFTPPQVCVHGQWASVHTTSSVRSREWSVRTFSARFLHTGVGCRWQFRWV